uniref:hypothetical protein n=1 Tax=Ruegeria sp. 6PALISEP08 TaxID=1225660 RepID=UPI00155DB856
VADVEAFYGADIDGSGAIGHQLPKQTAPSTAESKLAVAEQDLNLSDWDEAADELQFVPDLTSASESDATFDEYLDTQDLGVSVDENLSEIAWFNLSINESKEDLDPTLAILLEEDGFLL